MKVMASCRMRSDCLAEYQPSTAPIACRPQLENLLEGRLPFRFSYLGRLGKNTKPQFAQLPTVHVSQSCLVN